MFSSQLGQIRFWNQLFGKSALQANRHLPGRVDLLMRDRDHCVEFFDLGRSALEAYRGHRFFFSRDVHVRPVPSSQSATRLQQTRLPFLGKVG